MCSPRFIGFLNSFKAPIAQALDVLRPPHTVLLTLIFRELLKLILREKDPRILSIFCTSPIASILAVPALIGLQNHNNLSRWSACRFVIAGSWRVALPKFSSLIGSLRWVACIFITSLKAAKVCLSFAALQDSPVGSSLPYAEFHHLYGLRFPLEGDASESCHFDSFSHRSPDVGKVTD